MQGELRDGKMGYVGDIAGVDAALLEALLEDDFIPVVAPLSLFSVMRPKAAPLLLNVNGDTVAGEIARECRAEKLILLTDVEGIRDGSGKAIQSLSPAEAEGLLASGVASGGMIPKLKSCLGAGSNGITECIIIDGRRNHALKEAIEGTGGGTRIKPANT
jgi:acetylglutamate kinase